jgi:hypothetical protein
MEIKEMVDSVLAQHDNAKDGILLIFTADGTLEASATTGACNGPMMAWAGNRLLNLSLQCDVNGARGP